MSSTVTNNKKIHEHLTAGMRATRVNIDNISLREKIYMDRPIPSLSYTSPIDPEYDPLIYADSICYPENINLCLNQHYNNLFAQDSPLDDTRKTKIQLYIDWLSRKFDYTLTAYFKSLNIESNDILFLLINTYDKIRCIIAAYDITTYIANQVHVLYYTTINMNANNRLNLIQSLTGVQDSSNINADWLPSFGDAHVYIIEDKINILSDRTDIKITQSHLETIDFASVLLNQNTMYYVNTKIYSPIPTPTFVLINTYRYFCLTKLSPLDRLKILFVGGIVKSLWSITVTMDVDYLISIPQSEELTNFRFKPNTGISGIYDDYGLTYYHDESVYFPESETNYAIYQKEKYKIQEEFSERGSYPKCCSGLRIVRYFQFFKQSINEYLNGIFIHTMDDIVYDPSFHMTLFGLKFTLLDFELIRDKIKSIDLGKISKKQMAHFYTTYKLYKDIFKPNTTKLYSDIITKLDFSAQFSLKFNLYYTDSEQTYKKYVTIRQTGKRVADCIKNLTTNSFPVNIPTSRILSAIINDNTIEYVPQQYGIADSYYGINQRIRENVYITSLPLVVGNIDNVAWYVVIKPNGFINAGMKLSPCDFQCDPYSLCESYVCSAILIPSKSYSAYVAYVNTGSYSLLKIIFEIHKFYDKGVHQFDDILDGNNKDYNVVFGDGQTDIMLLK